MTGKDDAYPSAKNLYAFTREILGDGVSDNEIARRWGIDPRVFNDIKHGRIAVPRLERLQDLAKVLGINEHFVYAVGGGAPAKKLMAFVRRQDVSAAVGLLVGVATRAEDKLKQTEEALTVKHRQIEKLASELELRNAQLQSLVEQLLVAVVTFDPQGNVVHLNQIGRELFGIENASPGVPLPVAVRRTVFLDIEGRPFEVKDLPGPLAIRTRKPARAVFSVHRPGAKGRLVAGTATPMRAGKRFIGVISVLRDIEDILQSIGGVGIDMPLHPRLRKKSAKQKS